MSYVGDNYTHDVFFSYSHGNGNLHSWSIELAELIQSTLQTALADRDGKLSVYIDPQVERNEHLKPQLKDAVEQSATQVIVMTGYYSQSPWCKQEVAWFEAAAQGQDAAYAAADSTEKPPGRVFVIRAQNVAASLWPEGLLQEGEPLPGYRCCDEVPDSAKEPWELPWGLLDRKEKLQQMVGGLCRELAGALYKMRLQDAKRRAVEQRKAEYANPGPGPRRHRIFLGFVTEDLEYDRGKLRDALATASTLEVVAPERPADVDDIRNEVTELAASCDAMIQLCGRAAGAWQYDADGFVLHQIRQFEARRLPVWLSAVPWLDLAELSPTSAYANLLRAREEAGKLVRAAPTAAAIGEEIEADRRRRAPPVDGAPPVDLPECVVFIPSRREYADVETNIRQSLRNQHAVSVSVVPLTPVWNLQDPRDLREVAALRQKRAAEIDGEFLILAGHPTLEEDDFFEWRKLRRQTAAQARPPVAIVDGTAGEVPPNVPQEVRVLRLGKPDFEAGLADWLQACATRQRTDPLP
jgi:hypothetical protein